MELVDFSAYPNSIRNGSYSGNAGTKRGIVYEGDNWIVKYPKTTRSMSGNALPSYTSSPLSEYIGSHVYQILGIDCHDTVLGDDRGKLVVALRDFRPDNGILKEFRALKNAMSPELSDRFDVDVAESATGDRVNLDETLFHLEHNPIVDIPGIRERFCDMIVVDAIIDNPDRNNGNWGILTVNGKDSLAPVFDNGNAFAAKTPDEALVMDAGEIVKRWAGGRSIYESNGHQLSNAKLFAADIPGLREAAERIVGTFAVKAGEIAALLSEIPEEACSAKRKRCYMTGMCSRAQWVSDDFGLGYDIEYVAPANCPDTEGSGLSCITAESGDAADLKPKP